MSDATAVATASERVVSKRKGNGGPTERERYGDGARVIKEEEGRKMRKDAGAEERGRDVLVNACVRACVRCTLFPSPMSEPRLGYFRDISFERERGEKESRYGENARGERDDACVRACVHAYA